MKTYIANFGTENWAWSNCLERSSIAVMDDLRVHPYWQRGDRVGYIAEAQRVLRSRKGLPVTKAVASWWFNLNDILMATVGDLWIHCEKGQLWWAESLDEAPQSEITDNPHSDQSKIVVYYKLCSAWSSRARKGDRLPPLTGIHPKARDFLFTVGTFQQLSADNALYVRALINGDDLSFWHQRPEWKSKEASSRKGAVKIFNSLEITAVRLAKTAWETAQQSGALCLSEKKDKGFLFANTRELEHYAIDLVKSQEGLCALTGLPMVLDGHDGDPELSCSLDRIDSSRHYERGNLQVVCKFANRWKCASDNEQFKRLIELIRA